MNIAQICPRFKPFIGGIETHVEEISKRLAERGWKVEIITGDPTWKLKRTEMYNGIRITRLPAIAPFNSYNFIIGLARYVCKRNFDIIHVHGYHALPSFQIAVSYRRGGIVFTPHYKGFSHSKLRNLLLALYKPAGTKIFLKANAIISVSPYEMKKIIHDFDIPINKIRLIPNGVNWREIKEIRRIINFKNKNTKTILCVSRLESYKGIQYLIMALPKLPPEVNLKIIGSGPFEKELLRLSKKLNVNKRVQILHNLPRKKLLIEYAMADCFALLSKYEAYGLSVAEALAFGLPCIVANITGLSWWIDNKLCFGINYPINIDKLVTLIQKCLRITPDPNLAPKDKMPDWSDVVNMIEKVYLEIRA